MTGIVPSKFVDKFHFTEMYQLDMDRYKLNSNYLTLLIQ